MKSKNYLKSLCWMLLFSFLFASCQKDIMVIQDEAPPDGYVGLAKSWYEKNSRWGKKIKSELGQSNFTIDWTKYKITSNVNGDSVITVPIKSKKDTFYREIGLMMGKDNIPYGIIKEYLGNPFKESTILNIYTGTGRLLETAWYDHEKKTMKYIEIKREKKGLLNWVKKKLACTGCGGNMNDGFTMEEVEIDGYRPKEPDDLYGGNPIDIPGYPGNEGDPNEGVQSGGGGGGSNSGTNTNTNTVQENPGIKPCNFNFQLAEGVNWQAAAVMGYKVYTVNSRYGQAELLVSFNIEVGMPIYSDQLGRAISRAEAQEKSSQAFQKAIKQANVQYSLNKLSYSQIPGFVQTQMELYLNNLLGGKSLARVSTRVGTNPGAPRTPWDPNCK
ncbi:hypothetical protein ACR782_10650 [Sphingobacterium spiritivorum]|uniref:hypothetical protein n=1 Tax=Sphingobacterium spiritivorum TaxID=258 RepID=UPI003DA46BCB